MNTFVPPKLEEKIKAVGPDAPKELLVFDDFQDIPVPKSSDWLASHQEPKQTFERFLTQSKNVPDSQRKVIYLQPIGVFEKGKSPSVDIIEKFVGIFYQMPTKMLPALSENTIKTFGTRKHDGVLQFKTGDILNYLKSNLPDDAFCVVAISMTDLYPDDRYNFVFGIASLVNRVGVFSFARFDPVFYGDTRGPNYEHLLLRRSLKVIVHEIGHMFGITHCVWFRCLMMGSNHLDEADKKPMFFCPVCLRKAQHSIGFTIHQHYANMQQFMEQHGFVEEAMWYQLRLQHCK